MKISGIANCSQLAAAAIFSLLCHVADAGVILDSVTWDVNGHTYVAVEFDCVNLNDNCKASDITWDAARVDLQTTLGDGFDLVSITSSEEDDFVRFGINFLDSWGWPWLGAYRDPINGPINWAWVTGEDFEYTGWCEEQPGETGGYAIMFFDQFCWQNRGGTDRDVTGYIAESLEPISVPEPASFVLLAFGIVVLGFSRHATLAIAT